MERLEARAFPEQGQCVRAGLETPLGLQSLLWGELSHCSMGNSGSALGNSITALWVTHSMGDSVTALGVTHSVGNSVAAVWVTLWVTHCVGNSLCGQRALSSPAWRFLARPSPWGKHC